MALLLLLPIAASAAEPPRLVAATVAAPGLLPGQAARVTAWIAGAPETDHLPGVTVTRGPAILSGGVTAGPHTATGARAYRFGLRVDPGAACGDTVRVRLDLPAPVEVELTVGGPTRGPVRTLAAVLPDAPPPAFTGTATGALSVYLHRAAGWRLLAIDPDGRRIDDRPAGPDLVPSPAPPDGWRLRREHGLGILERAVPGGGLQVVAADPTLDGTVAIAPSAAEDGAVVAWAAIDATGTRRLQAFAVAAVTCAEKALLADGEDADGDTWVTPDDCDDTNPAIHPGAAETCNAADDDCDASIDEDLPLTTFWRDADGDAHGDPSGPLDSCEVAPPAGYAVPADDCDDANPEIHPGAAETCNAADDDCDASIDEDLPLTTYWPDADGDGFGDAARPLESCAASAPAGHVGVSGDCDDTAGAVHPGALEPCNGVDDDCDASVDEVTGDRFIAPGGLDASNLCADEAAPCGTITHAAAVACEGETVRVAEGEYVEDVVLDRRVAVTGRGMGILTRVRGTGAADVVRILASGASWNGIEIRDTPGRACLRIGDAAHPGLRDVFVSNAAAYGCAIGLVVDSTGNAEGPGGWNWLPGLDVRDNRGDGSPRGGTGILVTGGNAKLKIYGGRVTGNDGSGIVIEAPPAGAENRTIVFAGEFIAGNGLAADATGRSGLEAHAVVDLQLESNDITGHTGGAPPDDGQALLLDGVDGALVPCNRLRGNERGLVLAGGTRGVDADRTRFTGNTAHGVLALEGTGAGSAFHESLFAGNAIALENRDPAPLDARHSWWNAADGPSGAGGSGDAVAGAVDAGGFVARATAPLLVRPPSNSGGDSSADYCLWRIQQAIDVAAPGDLLLVAPGDYPEHVVSTKPLEIEGPAAAPGTCPAARVIGEQSAGSHVPVFRVEGVTGARVGGLTLRDGGLGTVCGQNTGDEVGLDLVNVGGSRFHDLCLAQNGVVELRVRGASHDNVFERVTIDGMIRDRDGVDLCGHRSQYGLLIDGAPACDGGEVTLAARNRFEGGTIANCAVAAGVRWAEATTLAGSDLRASAAEAWFGGTWSAGVHVEASDGTTIRGNRIGATGQHEGIRVAGAGPACPTAHPDSTGTVIQQNTIELVRGAGVRLWLGFEDPGRPRAGSIACNYFFRNGTGIFTDFVAEPGGPVPAVIHNDFRQNGAGVRNVAAHTLGVEHNWWGSTSGPGGNGPGTGDAIYGDLTWAPWLTSSATNDVDGDGVTECGGDCDDRDAARFPGAHERCFGGVDEDCDAATDAADTACSTLVVTGLRFTGATVLAWEPAPGATQYALARGHVPPAGFAGYDHACLLPALPTPTAETAETPAPGEVFYYLAAGQRLEPDGYLTSGPLGTGVDGTPRPDASPPCEAVP